MIYLYATALALIHYLLRLIDLRGDKLLSVPLSPDGRHYLAMGRGEPGISPFHLRWVLPTILGDRPTLWWAVSAIAQIATAPALCWYLDNFSDAARLLGVGLWLGLPGVFRTGVLYPVLTDSVAILVMVLEASAFTHRIWWLALPLIAVSGGIRETIPVFASFAALSPWPLLGIIPVIIRWFTTKPAPATRKEPWTARLKDHADMWFDPRMYLPWGICLILIFQMPVLCIAVLAVGYGQLLLGTDKARLYQWAFPLVIVAAIQIVPMAYAIPLLLIHWLNPWQKVI